MGDDLPGHLYGTYRTYKADTAFCAQWLVGEAKLAGYDVKSCLDHQERANGTGSRQTLPTQQFQLLASFIAQQKPKIQASAEFVRRLRNAISARKVCAAWHQDSQEPAVQKRNTTHEHFIDILEFVLSLFTPVRQPQARVRKPKPPLGLPQTVLETTASQNTFDALAAQTAKINIHQNKPISASGDARGFDTDAAHDQGPASNIEVTLEEPALDESETRFFACHCLLTDLHRFRAYNVTMWQDFVEGKTTLMVVSIMAHTIIDFANRLIEEFWDDSDMPESYANTLVDYFADCIKLTKDGLLPDDPNKPVSNDSSEALVKSKITPRAAAEFALFPAWSHVHMFLAEVDKQWQCSHETHQTDTCRPSPEPFVSTGAAPPELCFDENGQVKAQEYIRQRVQYASKGLLSTFESAGCLKVREDHLALLRVAFGKALDVPCQSIDHHPTIEDQVLRLLRSSLWIGRVELNVSFAVQLFFDVAESLPNSNQGDPLSALDASLRTVVLKADLHSAYWHKIGPWWFRLRELPPERHPQVWHAMSKVLCQHVLDNKDSHTKYLEMQRDLRGLLTNSPIARGVHQFCLTSASAVGSTLEADRIGIVLSFIHFYNACRQCGITTLPWRDLDYLIDTYGAEHLFMGGLPSTLQSCALKYRLVFGESLNLKSKDLALCRLKYHESRRPFASRATPFARLLWTRLYEGGPDKHTMLLKHTELILAELQRQGKRHRINIDATGKLLNGIELKGLNKHSPSLSHEEFLDSAKRQLTFELSHLEFDFFALTRRCNGMLSTMLDELAASGVDSHRHGTPDQFLQRDAKWDTLMEPIVVAETLSQYALMMEFKGLQGNTETPYSTIPAWVDQAEARFEAVARGMEKSLLKMKKDGVKDLCDAVGWTGPSEGNGNDHAAADHLQSTNGSKETGGSEA